jgi:hypothetical protein
VEEILRESKCKSCLTMIYCTSFVAIR